MLPSITVITITRGRPVLLRRAIASLGTQEYAGQVAHMIVVDDCPPTAMMLATMAFSPPSMFEWRLAKRAHADLDGPARLARLRNMAVRMATSDYVAFLDDDNEFTPNHLSSLTACIQATGCRAAHSWRQIYWHDCAPYLEARMPWKRDLHEAKRLYEELREKGIFIAGSNVLRDRADPKGHPNPARMVDMGEWLFERTLLQEFPFCEQYSYEDWLNVVPEDNKLLQTLVDHDVRIASTGLATLRYYLGGYSNDFAPKPGSSSGWLVASVAPGGASNSRTNH